MQIFRVEKFNMPPHEVRKNSRKTDRHTRQQALMASMHECKRGLITVKPFLQTNATPS
jgi:hypothetical protein